MKYIEKREIDIIAKQIMIELPRITQNLDEIKYIIRKIEDLIYEDKAFEKIENLIEFAKEVKQKGKAKIEASVDLYLDRIVKTKESNIENSIKAKVIQDQAEKISDLTGGEIEKILKETSITGKILDSILPVKELNFTTRIEEDFERFLEIIEKEQNDGNR